MVTKGRFGLWWHSVGRDHLVVTQVWFMFLSCSISLSDTFTTAQQLCCFLCSKSNSYFNSPSEHQSILSLTSQTKGFVVFKIYLRQRTTFWRRFRQLRCLVWTIFHVDGRWVTMTSDPMRSLTTQRDIGTNNLYLSSIGFQSFGNFSFLFPILWESVQIQYRKINVKIQEF